jgi:hypothetical protein
MQEEGPGLGKGHKIIIRKEAFPEISTGSGFEG